MVNDDETMHPSNPSLSRELEFGFSCGANTAPESAILGAVYIGNIFPLIKDLKLYDIF